MPWPERTMAISSLDTLDIARRLKGAGFTDAQAETVTEIFRDIRSADLANLASKSDIERLEAAIERLEARTKADFERLEAKIERADTSNKTEIARLEAKLESQIELLRRDLTIRLGSMIIAATAILLAAKFFA
jgi:hypothetical protein